jgi:ATPase family associated with various cellular activities (AAA)
MSGDSLGPGALDVADPLALDPSEPAWAHWVRLATSARVEQARARWQRRDRLADVHAEIDEILRAGPARPPGARDPVAAAAARAAADPAFAALAAGFALNERDREWLALLAMCQTYPHWCRVLGYLDDDLRPTWPTPAAAAALWGWPPGEVQATSAASALTAWQLAAPMGDGSRLPDTPWATDPDVVGYLCGARNWWSYYPGLELAGDEPVPGKRRARGGQPAPTDARADYGEGCLYPGIRDEILAAIRALTGTIPPRSCEVELTGPPGSGRRTLFRQVCYALGRPALVIGAPELGIRALRTARLLDAIPVWVLGSPAEPIPLDARPGAVTLVARAEPDLNPAGPVPRLSWQLPRLPASARRRLWADLAPARHPAPAMIGEWALTPAEIATAAALAPAGERAVGAATRRGLGVVSSTLVTSVLCPFDWDDLVVGPAVLERLRELESQVRLRPAVLDEWDFGRLTSGCRGVTALFAGPSGTGKTMAAQILARSLDLDLYRTDLAEVVDKYIGETEKRLSRIFDECERRQVLLLFDEADALFGQRTKVKDAHDRFANIEIDYLLQRMESFDGVAILATNRKADLDPAFLRRIRMVVDFLAPAPAERLRLWTLALPEVTPAGVPVSTGVDRAWLAEELALTGAEIKSVTLAAAYLARAGNQLIGMEHVLSAVRAELAKRGTVLRLAVNGSFGPLASAAAPR